MTRRFLLSTYVESSMDSPARYAEVVLDDRDIAKMLQRLSVFNNVQDHDPDVYVLRFKQLKNSKVAFYKGVARAFTEDGIELDNALSEEDSGYLEVLANYTEYMAGERIVMESLLLEVSQNGFLWVGRAKYSSVYVETGEIPWSVLTEEPSIVELTMRSSEHEPSRWLDFEVSVSVAHTGSETLLVNVDDGSIIAEGPARNYFACELAGRAPRLCRAPDKHWAVVYVDDENSDTSSPIVYWEEG